jgi:hypothetical protein
VSIPDAGFFVILSEIPQYMMPRVVLCFAIFLTVCNALSAQCLSGDCFNGNGVKDLSDGSRYVGRFEHGLPAGYGSCHFSDGSKYVGDWYMGKPHGLGMKFLTDGTRQKGRWQHGTLISVEAETSPLQEQKDAIVVSGCISGDCWNGEGVYVFKSGATYSGTFVNGEVNGVGICDYPDGSRYFGAWKDRFPHGNGTMAYADGAIRNGRWERGIEVKASGDIDTEYLIKESAIGTSNVQSGCISGDCNHGNGTMAYPDGSKYEGAFVNGKPQGKGVFYYANQTRFEGDFSGGLPHGFGTLIAADGHRNSGVWEFGEYLGLNTATAAVKTGCIEGDCDRGVGVYIFKDGTYYEGTFANGLPHGFGTAVYQNGEKYVGDFLNGNMHGNGTLFLSSGRPVSGYWELGEWKGSDRPVRNTTPDQPPTADIPDNVPSDTPPADSGRPKVWAFIVGVASYQHMPSLKYTDDDAFRFNAFLQSPVGGAVPETQIKMLIDDHASKDTILSNMHDLLSRPDTGDMLFVYLAGHGHRGAFLPADYDGNKKIVSHDDITRALKLSKAKYKVCIVDACHSGSLYEGNNNSFQTLQTYYDQLTRTGTSTALLLSSKSEETSLESSGLRQGVFSHYLLQGLRGAADKDRNNQVTIDELYEYVNANVKNYTSFKQTPILSGNFNKNMILSVLD